jgi:hypothetical protein
VLVPFLPLEIFGIIVYADESLRVSSMEQLEVKRFKGRMTIMTRMTVNKIVLFSRDVLWPSIIK